MGVSFFTLCRYAQGYDDTSHRQLLTTINIFS